MMFNCSIRECIKEYFDVSKDIFKTSIDEIQCAGRSSSAVDASDLPILQDDIESNHDIGILILSGKPPKNLKDDVKLNLLQNHFQTGTIHNLYKGFNEWLQEIFQT